MPVHTSPAPAPGSHSISVGPRLEDTAAPAAPRLGEGGEVRVSVNVGSVGVNAGSAAPGGILSTVARGDLNAPMEVMGGDSESIRNVYPPDRIVGARYIIEERVGEGGMGRIYKVRHRDLGKLFALTVIAKASRRRLAHRQRGGRIGERPGAGRCDYRAINIFK